MLIEVINSMDVQDKKAINYVLYIIIISIYNNKDPAIKPVR